MVYSLLVVLACHVILVTSRTATLSDVEAWRQLIRDQASELDNTRVEASPWFPTPDDAGGDQMDTAMRENSGFATTKRGLSMISRWKPFRETMNRMPTRARIFPVSPDMEFISAETRGIVRPIGQPLRWGRR